MEIDFLNEHVVKPSMASCIGSVCGSAGQLYISDAVTAENSALLDMLKIKAIVSIGITKVESRLPVYHLKIRDNPALQITRYFRDTFEFIDDHISTGNVLVHCTHGVSRSPAVVIGYLMSRNNETFSRVHELVKQKHPQTDLNPGFRSQLREFEKKVL